MNKHAFLYIILLLISFSGFTQALERIEYISPFHDGLAAVKKNKQWAFIDDKGTIVINYRDDLVATNFEGNTYPIFKDNRCLISEVRDGITYFGYIDKTGSIAIKPEFLNATPFNERTAIVLDVVKDTVGNNEILGKPIVKYGYIEVVIDPNGEIIHYLTLKPKNVPLSDKFIDGPPKIASKILADSLMAIWSPEKKWEIKKMPY